MASTALERSPRTWKVRSASPSASMRRARRDRGGPPTSCSPTLVWRVQVGHRNIRRVGCRSDYPEWVNSFRLVTLGVSILPLACSHAPPPPAAPDNTAPPPTESAMAVSSAAPPEDAPPPAAPTTQAKGPFPQSTDAALGDPSKATQKAPATFSVAFVTTAGDFRVDCTRSWAPNGVDRFYNLVKIGFFDDVAFFRVVKEPRPFVVQFGIHGNPEISRAWINARVAVDKPKQSNLRGTLTFAMAGSPDTRTTQLFINFGANVMLDHMGFAPICKVSGDGMDVVDRIESSYGEEPSAAQGEIQARGNTMLRTRYPLIDYIKTARVVEPAAEPSKK